MSLVTYELSDHIATITLNRPEAGNAINGALREELSFQTYGPELFDRHAQRRLRVQHHAAVERRPRRSIRHHFSRQAILQSNDVM